METPSITTPPPAPVVAQIPETSVQPPAPIVLEAAVQTVETPKENGLFGDKLELLQLGGIALGLSLMIYQIYYYRKAIETLYNYKSLQQQMDQLKLSVNQLKS